MALLKEIELASGVQANYHNVTIIKNAPSKIVQYQICSYVSKAAREDNRPLVYQWDMSVLPNSSYTGSAEQDVYKYLKTLPMFEGAEDI